MIQTYEGVESLACRLLLILNYASFEMVVKRPGFVVVLCSCFCKICLWHSWTFDCWLWQRRIDIFWYSIYWYLLYLYISSIPSLSKFQNRCSFKPFLLATSPICRRVTSLAGSELMKKRGLILLASPATFENTPFGMRWPSKDSYRKFTTFIPYCFLCWVWKS